MFCEKCIHYEVCDLNRRMRGNNNPLMYDKECRLFKDKSLYIELPCKVGDKAYFVLDDGDEIYMCEGQINDVSTRGMFFSSLATEENCEDFWPYSELGETVFLAKEEAEKALAERVL